MLDKPAPLDLITSKPNRMGIAPDYLQAERVVRGGRFSGLLGIIPAIGEHAFQPREAPACAPCPAAGPLLRSADIGDAPFDRLSAGNRASVIALTIGAGLQLPGTWNFC